MVSDKDRAEAVRAVALRLAWGAETETIRHMADSRDAVDALIALDWGPRPTVDAEFLGRLVNAAVIEASLDPFVEYFEACGIEVTDG